MSKQQNLFAWLDKEAPPPPKKAKTKEEKLQIQRKYEKEQRSRVFMEDWKQGREWLIFDKEKQTMTCSFCIEIIKPTLDKDVNLKKNYVFISEEGCTSLRLESIKKHETSSSHLKAKKAISSRVEPEKSEAFNAVVLLNKKVEKRLQNLFLNVHALAKNNRPFSGKNN